MRHVCRRSEGRNRLPGSRDTGAESTTAYKGASFIDLPPALAASGFRCSLHDVGGTELWHLDLTPEQARDAVTLQVPVEKAQPGIYELRVQSIAQDGGTLVNLTSYKYVLTLNNK